MIAGFREVPKDYREWNSWIARLETQGSFTATLTGFTTTVTGTLEWVKIGRRVTLYAAAAISGTSNATAFTITGIPVAVSTATAKLAMVPLTDNGTTVHGLASITGQTVTLYAGSPFSATGFTGSGAKAIPAGWLFSYLLEK